MMVIHCTTTTLIFVAILGTGSGQLVKISKCTCIGDILTYECAVTGPGFTIWQGSAFECPSLENSIQLRHSSYDSGTMGQCNDESITGRSLGVSNDVYTSVLNVTLSTDLIGRTVECKHNDFTTTNPIGSSTIITAEPPFPPTSFQLVDVTPGWLMFNWSRVDSNCSTLQYNVMSLNCDTCACTTPVRDTFTTCSVNLTLTLAGSPSQFLVQSIICNNISGNLSTQISVTLRVLRPPTIRAVVPTYSSEGKLISAEVNFTNMDSFYIADGIDGSALFYTIKFTDALMDVECNSHNISASKCIQGLCIASSRNLMPCSQSDNTILSITASNRLGEGPAHRAIIRSTNNYVYVRFETPKRIICNFTEELDSENRSCSITYGSCEGQRNITAKGVRNSSSIVIIDLPTKSLNVYCYVISASNGSFTIQIEGMSDKNPQRGSTIDTGIIVGISVPVSGATMLCLSFLIILIVYCIIRKAHQSDDPVVPTYHIDDLPGPAQSTHNNHTQDDPDDPVDRINIKAHIIFELEDKPTHLLKALKILKENQVNIKKLKIHMIPNSSKRKIYVEYDEQSGSAHTIDDSSGLDALEVFVSPKTIQIQKRTAFKFNYDNIIRERTETLRHVPGALYAFLKALHTHCKDVCEIDVIHEDIPGTTDCKKVTIMFIPTYPEEWEALYEKDKTEYKDLILS